jgi:SnoaL-like domain
MGTIHYRRSRSILGVPAALAALLAGSVLALAACGAGGAAPGTTPSGAGQSRASGATASTTLPPPGGTSMAVSYSQPPTAPTRAKPESVCGWAFKPTVDIAVTELGCYDEDQDGLAVPHRVGIFDVLARRLVAGVQVGPASTLDGAFRWEPLKDQVVLKAGRPYLVGAETLGTDDPEKASEVVYVVEDPDDEHWPPEIAFGGLPATLRTAFASVGFHAPTDSKTFAGVGPAVWMSPNFKFRALNASLPTSPVPSQELTGESHFSRSGPPEGPHSSQPSPPPPLVVSDGVYRWDAPGTASSVQAGAVARHYVAVLSSGRIPDAGLYTASATCDFWGAGRQVRGAMTIQREHGLLAHERDRAWSWSKDYHLLTGPGVAVCEGMYRGSNRHVDQPPDPAPYLIVLAVDGDKIAHEEIFSQGAGRAVTFYGSPLGPGDTVQVAAHVGAALGAAFATRDRAALQALLAPDVLFRDVTDRRGTRGRDAALTWWDALAPAKDVKIKNRAPIAGPGWAVVRWTARRFWKTGFIPKGVDESRNGATVIEVRDGKVVRMTLYLEPGEGGEWTILQEQYPN